MPIKNTNPFDDFLDKLDPSINPYVAQLLDHVKARTLPVTYGSDLKTFVGRYREAIPALYARDPKSGGPNPSIPSQGPHLFVEIGCHLGQTLSLLSADHPEAFFVGLDITFKRVIATGKRLQNTKTFNGIAALANAKEINLLFAPKEVNGVIIFFPDPWIKKARQEKNRLITAAFVRQIGTIIHENGFVWFKTDHKPYFDTTKDLLIDAGFSFEGLYPPEFSKNYVSTFENRFNLDGIPTFGGVFRKSH